MHSKRVVIASVVNVLLQMTGFVVHYQRIELVLYHFHLKNYHVTLSIAKGLAVILMRCFAEFTLKKARPECNRRVNVLSMTHEHFLIGNGIRFWID
jgi:hypothetical protein